DGMKGVRGGIDKRCFNLIYDCLRCNLPGPRCRKHLVYARANDMLSQVRAGIFHRLRRQNLINARDKTPRVSHQSSFAHVAETDRNRTCQTKLLGLTGFEDRGAHQDTYASTYSK